MFERKVGAAPHSVAVVCGDTELTYRELDVQANRLAHALIARGVGPETVVGVALRRSVSWAVTVLAVLKAGAAYLPMDSAYPAERLAYVVDDSGARLVVADAATAAELPVLDVEILRTDDPALNADLVRRPTRAPTDADRTAALSALNTAYVIYTSGSTGRPKGVAVTHTGFAPLLAAQVDRLKVTLDSRVLQFASPSFDASVWELVMALLSGAALVLVDKERIAPGAPIAETIQQYGVTHVTLPPPVLNAIAPGALASVETLVVAGDATTGELAARWAPGRRMINAYGPTETTVCATTSAPLPGDGSLPDIGTAVTDAQVHVLGPDLRPLPAGEIGELYACGPALARGYLGRPDLTCTRFVACPFGGPGERMYRTGDLAERTPAGDLVFHGRVDTQVKIRGFRIEPLEIEAALQTHPGVAHAAVLPHEAPGSGRGRQLVGYVVPVKDDARTGRRQDSVYGDIALSAGFGVGELRAHLAERLPDYMVPATFVTLDELPLTPNGKLDKSKLPAPEFRGAAYRAPRDAAEEALARTFAEVLGLDRVGIDDDFFAIGGDSIQSIQVVTRARQHGLVLSAREVFEGRTVAALAPTAVAGAETGGGAVLEELDGGGTGWLPLLPVAHWIRSWGPGFNRFAQAMVLDLPEHLDRAQLTATLAAVIDRHDMLRCRLVDEPESGPGTVVAAPGTVRVDDLLTRVECDDAWESGAWRTALLDELDRATARLDPANGAIARFVWFDRSDGRPGRLLVVLHHLVVDGVSWRVLMPDLAAAWEQVRQSRVPELPPVATSVRRWAHALAEAARTPARTAELPLWRSIVDSPDPLLGRRRLDPALDTVATLHETRVELPADVTEALLTQVPAVFRGGVQDGLLAALALAVTRWRRARGVDAASTLVRLEGHGREEDAAPGADLSRTVGWFTSVFPVRLDLADLDVDAAFAGGDAAGSAVKRVKEHLRSLPDKGIGYGLLRHLNPETAKVLDGRPIGQIGFNYLGRFSAGADASEQQRRTGFTRARVAELDSLDAGQDARMPAPAELDVNAAVADTAAGPRLTAVFTAPAGVLDPVEVGELAALWQQALTALVRHAAKPGAGGLTPSDVPLVTVSQSDIDTWETKYAGLSDIWPATPLQAGLLFHSQLNDSAFDAYQVQYALHLDGEVDAARMRTAGQALLERHPSLRAAFVPDASGDLVQLVVDGARLPWAHLDHRALDPGARAEAFEAFLAEDLRTHFDAAAPPLLRLTLVTMAPDRHELVLTAHHVLFDGWSVPVLMQDLLRLYGARGDGSALEPTRTYRDFVAWLGRQDAEASARVWSREVDSVDAPTLLAPQAAAAHGRAGIAQVDVDLTAPEGRELARLAADLGITLNTVVQGAWAVLLSHLTGRRDVVFASTVSGRPPAVDGVDAVVGMFLNTLPVRVQARPQDTFAELLTGIQRGQAALMDHHHHGLTDIYRTTGLDALFDTIIGFESFPLDRAGIADASRGTGITVTGIRSFTASHYPVTLLVFIEADGVRMSVQYQKDLLDRAAAQDLATRYGRVLRLLAGDPARRLGAVDLLDATERTSLAPPAPTGPAPAAPTVPELFERQVGAAPGAIAVTEGGGEEEVRLTYAELDARAGRFAQELVRRGVAPDTVVAGPAPYTADHLTAFLGVLKAGGTYLPVEPGAPARHLAELFADADPALVLTDPTAGTPLPGDGRPRLGLVDVGASAGYPATEPPALHPDHAAWLSHGHGQGAGTALTHRTVTRSLIALGERLAAPPVVRVGPGRFEDAVVRLLTALCTGGRVEFTDRAETTAAPEERTGVLLSTTPTKESTEPAVRSTESAVHLYAPAGTFVAGAAPADGPDLGTLLPGTGARLLGPGLRPVPPGATGELYLSGDAVTRGCPGHPGATATRFVADPYGPPGSRLLRTGDLARRRPDGTLVHEGRADGLVALAGTRVDPRRIARVLTGHRAVSGVEVVLRDGDGARTLVAYALATGDDAPDADELTGYAADRLPADQVPAAVVVLDAWPRTPAGTLDRAALPEPAAGRPYRAPRNEQEKHLSALFAEVLNVARVGIDDDFFELGGNSLLATRLTSRIRKSLGVSVSIRDIFQHRCIAELSRTVKNANAADRPRLRRMNRSAS
ncbi:amino acid adenylation domain-containing protein [Streptomyces sp. NPDC047315]|uniref:amino acid adenylation domain-containing protein n=1 Tax=Streptomyces sp. NPDC047315 TaxID=3155142 RepID=UPI0033D1F2F3